MNATLLTEPTLIARLTTQSLDRDWERFYRQYSAVILSFAQRQGLDQAAASDVLQETMLLLLRKFPHFKYQPDRGRFLNWLLTLVSGKVRDARKREAAQRTLSLSEGGTDDRPSLEATLASPQGDAVAALDLAWRQAVADEAMRRVQAEPHLKPETLQIFHAYAIEGRPAGEVARRFQIKENAVYQIRARIVGRLREEVAAIEAGEGMSDRWLQGEVPA
jgi:RNA polymerase sigma factor (sigma-70 family)